MFSLSGSIILRGQQLVSPAIQRSQGLAPWRKFHAAWKSMSSSTETPWWMDWMDGYPAPWWKMLTYSMRVSSQKKKVDFVFFDGAKKHQKTMGLPMVSTYVQS